MTKQAWKFNHSVADQAEWAPGMRKIFDYRDLGIKDSTNGEYVAHVIRANGKNETDNVQQWHTHECEFQMIFVIKGWATFEYEGQGQHTIREGDCVLQPPLIRHREVACSDDFEVLEIVNPGDFKTHLVDAPSGSE